MPEQIDLRQIVCPGCAVAALEAEIRAALKLPFIASPNFLLFQRPVAAELVAIRLKIDLLARRSFVGRL